MKVGYSKTYPILANGQWEKIWLEDEIASGNEEETRKMLYSLKKQVEKFHYESNAAAEKMTSTIVKDLPSKEIDIEWKIIKETLLAYEYKEDAQKYIDTTDYNMTIEAKQIINLKPSRSEQHK